MGMGWLSNLLIKLKDDLDTECEKHDFTIMTVAQRPCANTDGDSIDLVFGVQSESQENDVAELRHPILSVLLPACRSQLKQMSKEEKAKMPRKLSVQTVYC